MKDRYLFRGKDSKGKWRVGCLASSNMIDDGELASVYPKTIGQCTGLKDKNGVLIFEGDKVVSSYRNVIRRYKVVWVENQGSFDLYDGRSYICMSAFELEIIGNIHGEN